MLRQIRRRLWVHAAAACLGVAAYAGTSRAEDNLDQLKALVEQQGKEIQQLKQQLDATAVVPAAAAAPAKADAAPAAKIDEGAVKKIVADYLKDNPGAGMPSSVQTGYELGRGFAIRSAPNPNYVKWDDECRIPFELRFRGRIQMDYYRYKTTDQDNHFLGGRRFTQNANANGQSDESVLEIKRTRLLFEGTAFDPDLKYYVELDGNTRGLGGFQNNRVAQTTGGTTSPQAIAASPIGGGVLVDHAVRLFSAFVSYDFRGCKAEKGCGLDCPDGRPTYSPTYTLYAGKVKPFFGIEEVMGSGNEQMVEFSMADWFFDADDDNLLMAAGLQVKAFDDRFYLRALMTNGNESQFAAAQMDDYPGFNLGFWYDFGGSWNERTRRWDLFGDCLSDIDYSCCPVVRVGAACNIVPMDRRSLYGDVEQSRVFVTPGAPQGGTRLINMLSGTTLGPAGSHAIDEFDYYTYEAFIAAKYRGFSIWNEWYMRVLNNFQTPVRDHGQITYFDAFNNSSLFPNKPLIDYGMTLQGGYFIVPKKLELVARWSFISGDSGDIDGDGSFTRTKVVTSAPGAKKTTFATVRKYNNAFSNFNTANEYAAGINYYFKRQLLKWQTDVSYYQGGNPAGGGQSPSGDIAGSDGYLIRTQLQLWF